MPFFAWLMFRLTSHWKQFRISGSSRIGNDLPVQAHPALDNSTACIDTPETAKVGQGRARNSPTIRIFLDGRTLSELGGALVFVLPGLSGVPLGASITQPRKGQDEGL